MSSYSVPKTQKKTSSNNYVEVQNAKDLLVSINVSENEIVNIKDKQEVEIVLTADSNKKYTGTVSKIDDIGTYDSSGTTFPVEISLQNDGDIRIGMSVSCTINILEYTGYVNNNQVYQLIMFLI